MIAVGEMDPLNNEYPALLERTSTRARPLPILLSVRNRSPRDSLSPAMKLTYPTTFQQWIIKDSFELQTLLLLGALVQVVLLTILPYTYAILPAVLLAAHALVTTLHQCQTPNNNDVAYGVLPGRTTAQLPDPTTGIIPAHPSSQPLVIFYMGMRISHPLGVLAPGAIEAINRFKYMAIALADDPTDTHGLLGITRWRGGDRASNDTLLHIMFFRDVVGLHAFANGPMHREARSWLEGSGHAHIAAFHETYIVEKAAWETVYLQCPPTLLGATQVRCHGNKGEDVWVRPLVRADRPGLRGMMSRMGRPRSVSE